jgi:hypothetical protein
MMIYLLKSTLASGLLWCVYHFWLEQEKMHHFKRFYLLFSLLFAALVPLLPLPEWSNVTLVKAIKNVEYVAVAPSLQEAISPEIQVANWSMYTVLQVIYVLVCGILLLRYGFGLYQLAQRSQGSITQTYGRFRLVLLPDTEPAHSFFRTIFISHQDYQHPQLVSVILGHEIAHLRQGHSFDLLLIELLRVFFWFNPFLFLYKKAIQLNHEFLADEAVLREQKLEVSTYQLLLLSKIAPKKTSSLVHAFDYSITKKRLIMMTRMAKPHWLWFKKMTLLPLLVGMALVLGEKIPAQSTPKAEEPKASAQHSNQSEGVSQALMEEYTAEIQRIKDSIQVQLSKSESKWIRLDGFKIDHERLNAIYYHMSPAQRATAPVVNKAFPMLPPEKKVPTAAEWQNWSSEAYGIWIDDRKVDNAVLQRYKPEDFSWFTQSRLMKNAIPPGSPRRYQVNLYTHAGYTKVFIEVRKFTTVREN